MATATSVVHIYNGTVTSGGTDGNRVTETAVGGNQILIELHRGTESNEIPLAVRATVADCYLVQIASENGKTTLSLDAVHWSSTIFFLIVGIENCLFYIKSVADDDEEYGDTIGRLKMDFYAPV